MRGGTRSDALALGGFVAFRRSPPPEPRCCFRGLATHAGPAPSLPSLRNRAGSCDRLFRGDRFESLELGAARVFEDTIVVPGNAWPVRFLCAVCPVAEEGQRRDSHICLQGPKGPLNGTPYLVPFNALFRVLRPDNLLGKPPKLRSQDRVRSLLSCSAPPCAAASGQVPPLQRSFFIFCHWHGAAGHGLFLHCDYDVMIEEVGYLWIHSREGVSHIGPHGGTLQCARLQ